MCKMVYLILRGSLRKHSRYIFQIYAFAASCYVVSLEQGKQIVEKFDLFVVAPATKFFALRAPVCGMET